VIVQKRKGETEAAFSHTNGSGRTVILREKIQYLEGTFRRSARYVARPV
jgi:hypothetical protein